MPIRELDEILKYTENSNHPDIGSVSFKLHKAANDYAQYLGISGGVFLRLWDVNELRSDPNADEITLNNDNNERYDYRYEVIENESGLSIPNFFQLKAQTTR